MMVVLRDAFQIEKYHGSDNIIVSNFFIMRYFKKYIKHDFFCLVKNAFEFVTFQRFKKKHKQASTKSPKFGKKSKLSPKSPKINECWFS